MASVLIVEDDDIIAQAAKASLENAGYAVLGPARTAQGAINIAQVLVPNYAIVDLRLGSGTGISVARHLRDKFGTIVLFATGYPDLLLPIPSLTGFAVLQKPFDFDDLPLALQVTQAAVEGRTLPVHLPPRFSFIGGAPVAHD